MELKLKQLKITSLFWVQKILSLALLILILYITLCVLTFRHIKLFKKHEKYLNLSNREFAYRLSKIYKDKRYKIIEKDNFNNGEFKILNDCENSLVKVINSKKAVGVDTLRSCSSYLENRKIDRLFLIASSGITTSKETQEILEKYKNKLVILTLDDIIKMEQKTVIKFATYLFRDEQVLIC